MRPDPLVLLLLRVFECTSLAGALAWIASYTQQRGWHNVIGRNLLAKTAIIAAMLLIGLLTSLFRFSPGTEKVIAWVYVALLAAIGPVMAWRLVMFRRLGAVSLRCPSGHWVPPASRFCSRCGLPVPDGTPGDRPAADS